jgi:hypothetical protein
MVLSYLDLDLDLAGEAAALSAGDADRDLDLDRDTERGDELRLLLKQQQMNFFMYLVGSNLRVAPFSQKYINSLISNYFTDFELLHF